MLTRHEAVDRYDHSSLRYVIYAGAPMYRADQQHALRKLGQVLVQYFGLGEVTGNITVLPPRLHSVEDDPAYPIGSCGMPRTGMEIAILDPAGARLGPGETGEICVRGPAVFAGYWNNEEATAKAFQHGWFHTGDLGHLDAAGFPVHHRAGPATCTYRAAATSIRARSRRRCCCIRRWRRRAWSGCRIRNGGRAAWPCWCCSRARRRASRRSWRISMAGLPGISGRRGRCSGRNCRNRATARSPRPRSSGCCRPVLG